MEDAKILNKSKMTHNEDSIASSHISVTHSTASKEEKDQKNSYFSIEGREKIDKFLGKIKKILNKNL